MNKQRLIIVIVLAVLIVLSAIILTGAYMLKDITITNVNAPAVGVHGQKIVVPNTIKNRGIVSTGNFDVNFYLTPQKTLDNRTFIGKRNINDLAGRGTNSQNTPLIIPMNTTPGTYYILAYANMNKTVKELYYNNNGRFSTTTIVIS